MIQELVKVRVELVEPIEMEVDIPFDYCNREHFFEYLKSVFDDVAWDKLRFEVLQDV